MKLQDANGLDLLPQIKKRWPDTEVIVITGDGTIGDGRGSHANAARSIFIAQAVRVRETRSPIDNAPSNTSSRRRKTITLRRALETMSGAASPIFRSAAMQEIVRTVERVAPSDVTVLITGESGTGKEVIADLIHALSPRSKNKIIKINCAALPRELIESELFGSVKGAYTGAHADREGLFRQAEGGTLLLDEISEMPVDTQSKLLRVLQDQEVRPVGGKTSHQMNCRIIASTNRKPEEAIRDGKLREDLFYRISAISVHLPPLRERARRHPAAGQRLFETLRRAGQPRTSADSRPTRRTGLTAFDWPGNVRQLQNEIQRAVLLCEGGEVTAADLSITNAPASVTLPAGGEPDTNFTLLEGVERNVIIQTLKETGGQQARSRQTPRHRPPDALQQNQGLRD